MNVRVEEKILIYLYCIAKEKPNLKDVMSFADRLYSVHYKGVYAVVSRVKPSEFSEENLKRNLADLDWIKKKAGSHQEVIGRVMQDNCVLPFKLGTIFNTEDSLKTMIDENIEELKNNLTGLEGRQEWGIKIYCDMKRLKGFITKENKEVLKIDKEISSSPKGKAFFLKKKREELIKNIINREINEYGKESFEILKGFSVETKINRLLPKEVTEKEDRMILNAAFLVDKDKAVEFVSTANGLITKYSKRGISFSCTGPWPPYNFCHISKGDKEVKNG